MRETEPAGSTAEAVARRSYGKLIAFLAARTRDVAAAEDALGDAFAAALKEWPVKGPPSNPEAWLMTVAKRRIIDLSRRRRVGDAAERELTMLAEEMNAPADPEFPDHRLKLMFACAHTAIDAAIRAPLILQTVLGLDAARIASAFLISPAAMGQRLSRAKAKIRDAGIPFAVPDANELPARLEAVLDAIYAAYAEGWSDPKGTDVARRELAEEAVYLGGLVAEMLPEEPEALGLVALMLHADARREARRNENGEYVPLEAQDPGLWNRPMIERAEGVLSRAAEFGAIGRYQLEAAIQSAHVERRRSGANNWPAIVQLYDALLALISSPVAAINRAVALSEVEGPDAALAALDKLAGDARLASYQPYWAARASFLARTGAREEASRAYEIAIGLEQDPSVRRFLETRRSALSG
ncbi:MAG TPA: DUF6596 domain-containing protein [Micropepsaceae bacterium]|nr:DUF6596 domain-containing protein [Micropepsaceae bacterium]